MITNLQVIRAFIQIKSFWKITVHLIILKSRFKHPLLKVIFNTCTWKQILDAPFNRLKTKRAKYHINSTFAIFDKIVFKVALFEIRSIDGGFTYACLARQSLLYVWPSEPQTGFIMRGHGSRELGQGHSPVHSMVCPLIKKIFRITCIN